MEPDRLRLEQHRTEHVSPLQPDPTIRPCREIAVVLGSMQNTLDTAVGDDADCVRLMGSAYATFGRIAVLIDTVGERGVVWIIARRPHAGPIPTLFRRRHCGIISV